MKSLAESEMALHEALSLDDNCIESLLELGWIHLNIRRDVRRACSYSEKALQRWAEEGFSMGR
jgi:hypothetical protein